MKKGNRKKHILAWIVIALLITFIVYAGITVSGSYKGDEYARSLLDNPSPGVSVYEDGDFITFTPGADTDTGVILYPGAKVHADAYTPIADSLAREGYLCVLVYMPLNMSMLDYNKAMSIIGEYPEIDKWYIGGHSMGGLAAEHCASINPGIFSGIITMGSRIVYDFSDSDIPVLAIYATEDRICSKERIEKNDTPKPKKLTEVIIEGGCHGYFGYYGEQSMDGEPEISHEEQMRQTMDAIIEFLK